MTRHRYARVAAWYLVLIALLELPAHGASAEPTKNGAKRQAGEPLPVGAVARLGTTRFRDSDGIVAADLSPDGKTFAVLNAAQNVRFLDRNSGEETRHFHIDLPGANSLRYLQDGKALLVTVGDSQAQLLDAMTGKLRQQFGTPSRSGFRSRSSLLRFGPAPFTFSADGRILARVQTVFGPREPGGGLRLARMLHSTAVVWNTQTGKEIGHFDVTVPDQRPSGFRGPGAELLPDGKLLAVWSLQGRGKGAILFLDPGTGKEKQRLTLDSAVTDITLTPDGRTLLACHAGGLLDVVDMRTGKVRARLGTIGGRPHVSPDGKLMAIESDNTQLWDLGGLRRLGQCARPKELLDVSVGFTPEGKAIAWGPYAAALVAWDVPSGVLEAPVNGHGSAVAALSFSDAGRTLVSLGQDGTALAWDIASRRIRHESRLSDFVFSMPTDLNRIARLSK